MSDGVMSSPLLEPDILASDLVIYGHLGAPRCPEKRLLEAILLKAADDIVKYPTAHLLHQQALSWVQEESFEPHGFGWACAFLGLNPQATAVAMRRQQGLGWRERMQFNVMAPVKQRVRDRIRELKARRAANG